VAADRRLVPTRGDADHDVFERGRASRVGPDVVAEQLVARRARVGDGDPVPVAGDHVAGGGARAANRVPGGAARDDDAAVVRDGCGARRVRPDVVALDEVPARPGAADRHAAVVVAGDHVPGTRGRASDRVAVRAPGELDALEVSERRAPAAADADPVALDGVRRRGRAGEEHAAGPVQGDRVARTGHGAADPVVGGGTAQRDAVDRVADHLVAGNDVAVRPRAGDCDAVGHVEVDQVRGAGRRAADRVPGRAGGDRNAGGAVAAGRAGVVHADAVADDGVPARAGTLEPDPVERVGDDVVRTAARGRADRVLGSAAVDQDAGAVPEHGVSGYDVLLRSGARDLEAGAAEPDVVAGTSGGAANRVPARGARQHETGHAADDAVAPH